MSCPSDSYKFCLATVMCPTDTAATIPDNKEIYSIVII
jgi:hypothetical protein